MEELEQKATFFFFFVSSGVDCKIKDEAEVCLGHEFAGIFPRKFISHSFSSFLFHDWYNCVCYLQQTCRPPKEEYFII